MTSTPAVVANTLPCVRTIMVAVARSGVTTEGSPSASIAANSRCRAAFEPRMEDVAVRTSSMRGASESSPWNASEADRAGTPALRVRLAVAPSSPGKPQMNRSALMRGDALAADRALRVTSTSGVVFSVRA